MTMDWQIIGIIISVIINIVLAILLFFKSALNDILKDWWLERKKKKEKAIERLIEFKTKFNVQQSQCFLMIVTMAQKQAWLIMGRELDQFTEDTYQTSMRTSAEARNAISKFIDYLPASLINKFKKYEELFTETIRKIMENKVGKEDVLTYSKEMTALVLEINNHIDSMLREKLD